MYLYSIEKELLHTINYFKNVFSEMSPIIISFISALLTSGFEMTISQGVINNGGNQKWIQGCGCPNGTKFLTQEEKLPVRCACIMNDYRKDRGAEGGENYTTVSNSFEKISVMDVNEAQKKITSLFWLYCRWKDSRISITFPNNESRTLITKVTPKNHLFPIWAPSRALKEPSIGKWIEFFFGEIFFVKSIADDEAILEGRSYNKATLPCDLDFTSFPFDMNRCEFRIRGKTPGVLRENKKTDYLKHTVPAFDVYITLFSNKSDDNNETTNDYGFDVEIKRRIFPYVVQYYLPCASIVVISSVSFIIPLTAIPGRVSLVVTLFLTLSNLMIHLEVSIPTRQITKLTVIFHITAIVENTCPIFYLKIVGKSS